MMPPDDLAFADIAAAEAALRSLAVRLAQTLDFLELTYDLVGSDALAPETIRAALMSSRLDLGGLTPFLATLHSFVSARRAAECPATTKPALNS